MNNNKFGLRHQFGEVIKQINNEYLLCELYLVALNNSNSIEGLPEYTPPQGRSFQLVLGRLAREIIQFGAENFSQKLFENAKLLTQTDTINKERLFKKIFKNYKKIRNIRHPLITKKSAMLENCIPTRVFSNI